MNASFNRHRRAACLIAPLFVVCASAVAQSTPAAARGTPAPVASFQALSQNADAARDAGNLAQAVPLYRKALALNPRWAEGWWSLGTIDYDGNRYQAAAAEFKKVIAIDPNHGTAHALLGLSEFELGDDEAALANIELSKTLGVEENPQLRDVVLYHEGILLQRAGRYDAASKALSSLCLSGVRSENLAVIFGMTMLHIDAKTQPTAGTPAADVVEHIGRGACLSAAKEYDDARREYDGVLAQYPHFPMVYFAYGRFLLEARDRAGAIEAFKQQIAEEPNSVLARLEIAATEYKVDSAAGLPYAQQAVKIDSDSPLPHYLLGLLLLDTGDYQGSIAHLEIAKKSFPQDAKIYWSLNVAYAHVGRQKEAAEARAEFARINQANKAAAQTAALPDVPDAMTRMDEIDKADNNAAH